MQKPGARVVGGEADDGFLVFQATRDCIAPYWVLVVENAGLCSLDHREIMLDDVSKRVSALNFSQ